MLIVMALLAGSPDAGFHMPIARSDKETLVRREPSRFSSCCHSYRLSTPCKPVSAHQIGYVFAFREFAVDL